jgi:hypothetical protein
MRRLLVPLAALLLVIVALPRAVVAQDATPAAESATSVTTPARTDARIFLPFTADGLNSALTVASQETGVCAAGSLATASRDDAWECTSTADRIYDPCFENPFATDAQQAQLACIASPFDGEVVLLTLDEPLQRQKASPVLAPGEANLGAWELPWALELANGEQCLVLPDVELVLAGESVYYDCAGGGSILGDLNRGRPLWTVSYWANGAVGTTLTDVAVAWN